MNDPASLQNLNDLAMPAPVPLWPPAPGWYLVLALSVLLAAWLLRRAWLRQRRNRYRKQALAALSRLAPPAAGSDAHRLAELLKRAALTAWPRSEIAALSGAAWHRFLDRTAASDRFSRGAGATLDRLAYGDGEGAVSETDWLELKSAAEHWLKRHRAPAEGG